MNTIQRGVITLLKSAVMEESLPLPKDFSLEEADKLIKAQSLLPLIYQGACHCDLPEKKERMLDYRKRYYQLWMFSDRQLLAAEQLFRKFEENGIDYMPLKGLRLKAYYPRPELRCMGDGDILIRIGQYEKIRPIMQSLGFTEGKESQHEYCWHRQELRLELHKCLFSNLEKEFYACFGDGWAWAQRQQGTRWCLPPEAEFVYLLTHTAKHFRGSGVGCRHFLDLYLFLRKHPDMDETRIEQLTDRVRLRMFYHNTRKLLDCWFEDGPEDITTETMTRYLFSGGSWGNQENKDLSLQVRRGAGKESLRHSRWRMLWQAIFPPMADMQYRYLILLKWPGLYPAVWVWRAVVLVFGGNGAIRRKFRQIKNTGDAEIDAHRQLLKSVGLEFS